MIKLSRYSLCAATAALFAASLGVASASVVSMGDTFSIEAVGYNTADPSANIYIMETNLVPAFYSTPESYASSALGGQTVTVTSSQTTSGAATTDTISISVPTNFVPAGTLDNDGNQINAIQISIGADLADGDGNGLNPLDFSVPISSYTPSGTVTFNFGGTPATDPIPQSSTLASNGTSYSDIGEVYTNMPTTPADAVPISNDDVTSFSFTITSTAVPEPSTWAAMLVGGGLLGLTFRGRFRKA